MIFDSEIQIVNNTPIRGSTSGKRVRISGSTGKLYAHPNKAYKFSKWVDPEGQTLSTTNPLVITNWSPQTIEVVFDHIILDTQFYKEHDALGMQTWHHEVCGRYRPEELPSMFADTGDLRAYETRLYYTQGQQTGWVTTRTGPDNVVWNTYEKDWGYSWDTNQTPQIGGGTFDGTTVTGSFYRSPLTYDTAPSTGLSACLFIYQPWNPETRPWSHTMYHNINYGHTNGLYEASSWYNPFYGIRNSPTVGASTVFPLLHYTPVNFIKLEHMIYPLDATGMENVDQIIKLQNTYSGSYPDAGENIYNLDGMVNCTSMRDFSHGYASWPKVMMSMPYDENIPTPRGMEVMNYWPHLSKFGLHVPVYGHTTRGGPTDTLTNTNSSNNWVAEYQHTPKSGSVLYNLRYSKLGHLLLYRTAVHDTSVFSRYGKSLKFIEIKSTLDAQVAHSEENAPFQAHDFSYGKLKGLKNLRALYIYELYHDNTDSSTTWTGLTGLTSLRHLHIQATHRLVKNLRYSDIPPNVEYAYIVPSPIATTNDHYPGELVTGSFIAGATGLENVSRYNFNITSSGVTKEDIT
jgi:hypothetical protein